MTALVLPYPPSVNHYYGRKANGNMFVKRDGLTYRQLTAVAVREICPRGVRAPKTTGRLKVEIVLRPPDRRRRDLDNTLKCLLDALMHAGCYEDDSQIDDLRITRGEVTKDGRAVVVISDSPNAESP